VCERGFESSAVRLIELSVRVTWGSELPVQIVDALELSEFRGVRRCREPIRLSSFTVLVGRNNVGKTAVLEALFLMDKGVITRLVPFVHIELKALIDSLHGGFSSLIYGYTGRATITYYMHTGEKVYRRVLPSGISSLALESGEAESEEVLTRLLGLEDAGSLPSSIAFLPNDSDFLRQLLDSLRREDRWMEVEKSGANVRIVRDLVARVVSDRFTEASVRFNSVVLRKELPDGRVMYVKAADLGDGVERVLAYGLCLETYRPRLVLWDDVEASAHPGLVEAVLEWLASRDWQVVLSTHSYDVLERLVAVEPEEATVVVLRKGADDVLESKVLSLEEVEEMLERHVDVRRVIDIL